MKSLQKSQPVTPREAASELLRRRRGRCHLLDFTQYTFPEFEVNWHHRVLCDTLDRFAAGEIPRLMIFAPPRHTKSELVSRRLPAFILGRNPDARVIACSHTADLSSAMSRDVQRILAAENYRRLFPDTQLPNPFVKDSSNARGTYRRTTDYFEVVKHSGNYRSAGVRGPITGHGFNFGIIDDPIKNDEEAYSPTTRAAILEWYRGTFYTRQQPNASILITLTRWHRNDLAGALLEMAANDPKADQWEVLTLPAVKEHAEPTPHDRRQPGEALWPARYGIDFLEATRSTLGPVKFSALYQQTPKAEGGSEWPDEWFDSSIYFADWPPESSIIAKGIGLDPSKGKGAKHGDYSAFVKVAVTGDGMAYVQADMSNTRNASQIVEEGIEHCRVFKPHCFAVEINQFQELLATEFARRARELGRTLPIYGIDNRVNKDVRIRRITPWLGQRQIRFKGGCPDTRMLVQQLRDFPNGEHDDGPDALEMILRKLSEGPGSEIVGGQIGA